MLIVHPRIHTPPKGTSGLDNFYFETKDPHYCLTFDGNGGPHNHVPAILKLLKERNAPATFFLNGEFMKRLPDTIRELASSGHEIGNHCLSHNLLCDSQTYVTRDGLTREGLKAELEGAEKIYFELTGSKMSKLWRAPYGSRNDEILRWGRKLGYEHLTWNINTEDWRTDMSDPASIGGKEIRAEFNKLAIQSPQDIAGSIILMHLGPLRPIDPFIDALADIMDDLKKGWN